MDIPTALSSALVSLAVAVVTAGLGWWQWTARRNKELAGLYVNPFLVAAEELQSRLYNLLERDGLQAMCSRMSNEEIALETFYLASRYFGWERVVYQHGPFTHDQTFISLSQELRKAFATNNLDVGPFCIFRTEQAALGQLVVQPTTHGASFQVLAMHEFRAHLEESGLAERPSIRDALMAFEDAILADPVRKRLARIQAGLANLLEHLENRGQVRLLGEGKRKRAREERISPLPIRDAA